MSFLVLYVLVFLLHIDSSLRSASVLKSLIEDLFKTFDTSWFDLESEFEFITKALEFNLMLFRPNHNNGQLIQIWICWILCPCIQLDDFVWQGAQLLLSFQWILYLN